jgi:pimeloyl-ACP methyl ester carboxylesterase
MRAREPDTEGYVDRGGVKLGYEVFGDGPLTLLLLPTWTIVHSRFWKAQVPYLSRHAQVVTFDGPGNGRSDRPLDAAAYTIEEAAAAALDVLDAVGVDRAVLVSLSAGAYAALHLMAHAPDRVLGSVFIASAAPMAPPWPARAPVGRFDAPYPALPPSAVPTGGSDPDEHWAKFNRRYWADHYQDFAWFFFGRCFNEPHSTKQIEDCVAWAVETSPEVLSIVADGRGAAREQVRGWAQRSTCPVLVIHGSDDAIVPVANSEALAAATGGDLVVLEGAGHIPLARDPVKVNLLIRDFAERLRPPAPAPATWTRATRRRKRALYLSPPIGLGHAQRDVAVARELRRHHPHLEIDWLAQHPVTRVLEAAGERVHPASAWLASESAHIEGESGEHDLHCFQVWRRMDEILAADFMVFHDVVRDGDYDLVIGDEAWDVDYFLHENPELKRFAYIWFTDFLGWLPLSDGGGQPGFKGPPGSGEREAFLTADYNAEMIEQIARYPRVRDRALFVGDPDDIVPDAFGPGLPAIREWTQANFEFTGYVTGFDPTAFADREAVRDELGYRPDERVCVVTVGGSGVGGHLLRRVIDAYPEVRRKVPNLRMVVVAGPRIDPSTLPERDRAGGALLRPRPVPPPRRVRSGGGPGGTDDVHGAHRHRTAVHLRAVAPPLRAEHPRPPPAGAPQGRSASGLRRGVTRRPRRGDRIRDRTQNQLPAGRSRRRRPCRRPDRPTPVRPRRCAGIAERSLRRVRGQRGAAAGRVSRSLCRVAVLGEQCFDDLSGRCRVLRFALGDERDQGLPECPATASHPGRVVHWEPGPERVPALTRKQRPRNRHVACGIPHSRAPEVDDGAQATVLDQQVRGSDISVEPDRAAVPCRAKGRLPHLVRCGAVDLVTQGRDRLPGFGVVGGQRSAPKEVVLSGRRTARGIDLVKGGEKLGQHRELA